MSRVAGWYQYEEFFFPVGCDLTERMRPLKQQGWAFDTAGRSTTQGGVPGRVFTGRRIRRF